jgi:predicted RecB family nuclease
LLLIWEGQPPHGCRSLAELNAAPPHGADQEIQSRLWDLLPVVRNNVYHPRFAGSFSLKAVLPALVPVMTYEGMDVANGTDAGLAWESLVRGGLDQSERERTRKALLDYCGQDTLALVKVLHKLRTM